MFHYELFAPLSHRRGGNAGSCSAEVAWAVIPMCWSTIRVRAQKSRSASSTWRSVRLKCWTANSGSSGTFMGSISSWWRPHLASFTWWPKLRRRWTVGSVASVKFATLEVWRMLVNILNILSLYSRKLCGWIAQISILKISLYHLIKL